MSANFVREYGCVLCQSDHREGDALFAAHLHHQAKHGWRWVHADCVYFALNEDAVAEAFRAALTTERGKS